MTHAHTRERGNLNNIIHRCERASERAREEEGVNAAGREKRNSADKEEKEEEEEDEEVEEDEGEQEREKERETTPWLVGSFDLLPPPLRLGARLFSLSLLLSLARASERRSSGRSVRITPSTITRAH